MKTKVLFFVITIVISIFMIVVPLSLGFKPNVGSSLFFGFFGGIIFKFLYINLKNKEKESKVSGFTFLKSDFLLTLVSYMILLVLVKHITSYVISVDLSVNSVASFIALFIGFISGRYIVILLYLDVEQLKIDAKAMLHALLLYYYPYFYSKRMIKSFFRSNDFDLELVTAFLEKFPKKSLTETNFRTEIGLGKENYSDYVFLEKVSPSIKRICELMGKRDFSHIKTVLGKQDKKNTRFICNCLAYTYFAYDQLQGYREMYDESLKFNSFILVLEEIHVSEFNSTAIIEEAIEKHIEMMRNCDLNGLINP